MKEFLTWRVGNMVKIVHWRARKWHFWGKKWPFWDFTWIWSESAQFTENWRNFWPSGSRSWWKSAFFVKVRQKYFRHFHQEGIEIVNAAEGIFWPPEKPKRGQKLVGSRWFHRHLKERQKVYWWQEGQSEWATVRENFAFIFRAVKKLGPKNSFPDELQFRSYFFYKLHMLRYLVRKDRLPRPTFSIKIIKLKLKLKFEF